MPKPIKVVDYRAVNLAWLIKFKEEVFSKALASQVELVVAKEDVIGSSGFEVRKGDTLYVADSTKTTYVVTKPYGDVLKGEVSQAQVDAKAREEWSTEDVCEYVIKPACVKDQCTYLELITPKKCVSKREYQGTFVSQARRCRFADLVGSLEYFYTLKKADLSEQFVWLDIFSANQPKLTARNVEPAVRKENERQLTEGLHQAIANFDERVMFMDKWDDAAPLSRAWCIWEVFGIALARKRLEIALPESEYDRYLKFMVEDFWNVTTKLSKIDVSKAECFSKEDLKMIQEAIRNRSSYAQVNEIVMSQLRSWVASTAESELQKEEAKKSPDGSNIGRLASYVGIMYLNQGQLGKAETLLQKSLLAFKKTYGDEHQATALSLNNLAGLRRRQGMHEEARRLFQESLRIRRKTLGNQHPEVADSLNNLGELFLVERKLDLAQPLLAEALAIRRKVLGKYHPQVAESLNQLAGLANAMGKRAEAQQLYMETLTVLQKTVGKEHPHYALTLSNLSSLYFASGQLESAKVLLEEALAVLTKVYGTEHPSVVDVLSNLSVLLAAQGKREEAKAYGLRAYEIAKRVLGVNHPITKKEAVWLSL